jgi:serine--tRNA ligase
MLTLKQIRENAEGVVERLRKKHFEAREAIDEVLGLDEIRRNAQQELDASLARQKAIAKEIGDLMKKGAKEQAEAIRTQVASLKELSKKLEEKKAEAEAKIREILLSVPNLPADIVPEGATAEDNVCVKTGGVTPDLGEDALPHWELAKIYDLIDFELGVKISGAGFPVYKGYGARLQRALVNFFLDNAREAGYLEVQPPYVVNEDSGYGTGQLPDKEGQMYHVGLDNLYLIPTAEVPVTNIYRDVILDEKDLPVRNTAYSACFRREAGSYGKDVRGLNRLHQFDKVEIVCIDKPERSYQRLDEMVAYVETLVTKLELPWRILRLSGGDMSFTSALTYDFEVFSAAQKRWLEVSSVSNFESYQANRLHCRYRDAEQGVQLVHTLNGSALALPRIVAALLENHQTPEGIRIPEALRPYTGFDLIPFPEKK